MVLVDMMAECKAGDHASCPRTIAAPPGIFGGRICDCPCHFPKDMRDSTVDLEFWRAIKDGNDLGDFELYLQHFPEGKHAELARTRIAKLKGKD